SEYGARRHHACHEVGDGRLAPLLATAKSGGITQRDLHLRWYDALYAETLPRRQCFGGIAARRIESWCHKADSLAANY
ncbi:hypothetical protein, partial [Xanthomonas phaseoli]